MKRNLRFYFALMFARGTALVFKAHRAKGHVHAGFLGYYSVPGFLSGRMPETEEDHRHYGHERQNDCLEHDRGCFGG